MFRQLESRLKWGRQADPQRWVILWENLVANRIGNVEIYCHAVGIEGHAIRLLVVDRAGTDFSGFCEGKLFLLSVICRQSIMRLSGATLPPCRQSYGAAMGSIAVDR